MLSRLFPESIFSRKLNPNAERRLKLSQARAEETIIRGHVDNALMFVDTLAEDLSFDRAIDTYVRVMGIPEPLASTVATRALVQLGRGTEAAVGLAALEERARVPLVPLEVGALVDGLLVPREAEPLHPLEDRAGALVGAARLVGILDAQQELAAVVPDEQPVEEGRARATDVEVAGGGRREAKSVSQRRCGERKKTHPLG